MEMAIRRLNVLEFIILGVVVVLALIAGALLVWLLESTIGVSFRLVWGVASCVARLALYPAMVAASLPETGPSGPPNTIISANLICISVNLFGTPILTMYLSWLNMSTYG